MLAKSFDGSGVKHHSVDKRFEEDDCERVHILVDLNDKGYNPQDFFRLFCDC